MIRLIIFLAVFVTNAAFAGPPIIFSGNYAKTLKQNINLFDKAYIVSGTADPSSVATDGLKGSIYLQTGAGGGNFFLKQDNGVTTNWINTLTAISGWKLSGNAGTTPASQFLGTTDGQDLVFRTNNTEKFRITSAGAYDTTLGLGILHSDASGILSSSAVNLAGGANEVTGTLPTGNGGTGLGAIGTANQVLGVNAGATGLEYKSVSGTANRLSVSHAANSISLNVDTTFLPSPVGGDANKALIASGADASSWSLIANANIAAAGVANIARDKLAAGTVSTLVGNDGSGVLTDLSYSSVLALVSPLTTKGDLFVYGASNTRLPVGANGNVLTADSAQVLGVKWAPSPTPTGTNNYAAYFDGAGLLSSEQFLSVSRGGSGAGTFTANGVLLGNTTSAFNVTAAGIADQVLRIPGAGGAPAFGAIDLTKAAAVTGALPIGNGGTGQTTKTAAFDALSPNTAKGDLIVHNGTNNVKFAACSDGQIVEYDASQASGIKCVNKTPTIFGTRQTGRAVIAGTGITSGASHMSTTASDQLIFVAGAGGVTVTANPQIEAGTAVGQKMTVCGTDDTNYVQLSNGTGLSLNGAAVLGKDDCLSLQWLGSDGSASVWGEISRNN